MSWRCCLQSRFLKHLRAGRERAILQHCESLLVTYGPYQLVSMAGTVNTVPVWLWTQSLASHWTLQTAAVAKRSVRFHVRNPPFLEQTFCLSFWAIIVINSDYFSKRYLLIYLCNGDGLSEETEFSNVIWISCRLQISILCLLDRASSW